MVAALVSLVLVAAGCGDDGEASDPAAGSTAAPSTEAPSTAPSSTTAPAVAEPELILEMQQETGENPFARIVYGCRDCTPEQVAAIAVPDGWTKPAPMQVVPAQTSLVTPDVPEVAQAMDFVPEIPGDEFVLFARVEHGQLLGVGTDGPMALVEVERTTTFTYPAGSRIHEVVDTDGATYVMFGIAVALVDDGIDIGDADALAGLGLPDGWSYSSRVLTDDLVVDSGGLAHVFSKPNHTYWQRYP
jgi:hypothetical protein